MASIDEIREVRLAKVKILEQKGINSYPAATERNQNIINLKKDFDSFVNSAESVTIVGRVMSMRGQGALIFIDLYDGTGRMQSLIKKDGDVKYFNNDLDGAFDLFKETVDIGDFVQVTGTAFKTQRGEDTILVQNWKMAAKSLRPIPDEWYGIKDEDDRYRRRYIDILLNEELKNRIERRSVFWNTFRTYLLNKNFIEVETPVLETKTGGAEARPFITHHNSLDIDVYLRISAGELWQKKLLVSGLSKVFEIGRIFRNEGMSNEHLQDYTQIEFYEAYSDYNKGMKMVEELYKEVALKTFGTTKFKINDAEVDLNDEWQIYDYVEIIKQKRGVDVLTATIDELISVLEKNNIKFDKNEINTERAADLIWKTCRKELTGPGFLIGVPKFLEPLAKKDEKNPLVVERFQIILGGTEVGKGFSELNDPVDQSERFEHQEKLREAGDDEAQMKDMDYVEAMEYGMPPAFGFGTSERMFAILSGVSVREAQVFPLMRPKEEN